MKTRLNRFLTSSITLVVCSSSAFAATTWNGTVDSSWATDGNWSAGIPDGADLVTYGAGTGPGTAVAEPTQTLDGPRAVSGLTLGNSNAVTINSGTGTGNTLTIGSSGILLNSGTGAGLTIAADVVVGASQSWVTGGLTNTRPITVSGAVDLGSNVLTVNSLNTNVVTLSGVVNGTGGMVLKTGVGTLNLTGATTLTGTDDKLTISAGTVRVANGASLDLSGGVIRSSATSAKGTLNIDAGGSVTAASLFSSWGTTMALNGTLTTSGAFIFSGGSSTVTGTGTAKVGTLTNTNYGNSNINGARFNIGSGGITRDNGALTLGATTIGSFADWSSSAPIELTNTTTGTTFNTLDSEDGTTARTITLNGALSGAGKLNKTGAGTLKLTGTNTYNGTTSVNQGTLEVNGSILSSSTTVASGATITGIGRTGALNVQAGGFINPGNSPGILNTGDFVLGGTYNAEIAGLGAGTGYDQINVNGSVTLGGLLSLTSSYAASFGEMFLALQQNLWVNFGSGSFPSV